MRILLITILFSGFIFSSCEDDPIIEPSTGTGSPGGSYARLAFPSDTTLLNNTKP
jgi:hypothetical protein